jgi:L-ascorbate metabolism protein UlaG (beta-lactamase superfamily)
MSPKEALHGFSDLKGKVFVPMHFGTYDLSDEPIGEGARYLKTQQKVQNIKMLDIGEIYKI